MARKPRIDLPGIPQHVVQRGVNRERTFFTGDDYRYYLHALKKAAGKHDIRIHAYCLMTNHVHLLVTPDEQGAVSALMQSLGRRYVRFVNTRYERTGTLWEGRFRSSLVDSGQYLLNCYRYIEMNPVRARMVEAAEGYRWSSYRHNALGEADPVVTPHETYLGLADKGSERPKVYREYFPDNGEGSAWAEIRGAIARGLVYGSEEFKNRIEASTGIRVRPGRPGRPRKRSMSGENGV
ncbi:MAG TPA: transposase [Gammaproteobacteria bacterium]|nr:transposase [Gammaproteobacteria bacterium]